MNRNFALSALQIISDKVQLCAENEARPEVVDILERASRDLVAAVQGDAYAKEGADTIVVSLRAGFLSSPPSLSSHRVDILENVKALYSYISRRPDPTTGRVSLV